MTKTANLTAKAESLRLEYVVQEQLYINNYYHDHTVAMVAFEQMTKLKALMVATREEIRVLGESIASKL